LGVDGLVALVQARLVGCPQKCPCRLNLCQDVTIAQRVPVAGRGVKRSGDGEVLRAIRDMCMRGVPIFANGSHAARAKVGACGIAANHHHAGIKIVKRDLARWATHAERLAERNLAMVELLEVHRGHARPMDGRGVVDCAGSRREAELGGACVELAHRKLARARVALEGERVRIAELNHIRGIGAGNVTVQAAGAGEVAIGAFHAKGGPLHRWTPLGGEAHGAGARALGAAERGRKRVSP